MDNFYTVMAYGTYLWGIGKAEQWVENLTAQAMVPLCVAKPWKCSYLYASAQTPLPAIVEGVPQYDAVGVPRSKLVIAMPWFATDNTCNQTNASSTEHPELCASTLGDNWDGSPSGRSPGYGQAV